MALSRDVVYSNDPEQRNRLCGAVMWINDVLSGLLEDRYTRMARERLGLKDPTPGLPADSDYMDDDNWNPDDSDFHRSGVRR